MAERTNAVFQIIARIMQSTGGDDSMLGRCVEWIDAHSMNTCFDEVPVLLLKTMVITDIEAQMPYLKADYNPTLETVDPKADRLPGLLMMYLFCSYGLHKYKTSDGYSLLQYITGFQAVLHLWLELFEKGVMVRDMPAFNPEYFEGNLQELRQTYEGL